jgi:hypothetical protein
MIYYKLSSRQREQIASGDGLRLAVPLLSWSPVDGDPAELRQWFLDSIPEVPPETLGELKIGLVWVHLLNRGGGERSLSMTIGEIVDANNAEKLPCYSMRVVIGVVAGGGRLTRWPGGEVVFARADR